MADQRNSQKRPLPKTLADRQIKQRERERKQKIEIKMQRVSVRGPGHSKTPHTPLFLLMKLHYIVIQHFVIEVWSLFELALLRDRSIPWTDGPSWTIIDHDWSSIDRHHVPYFCRLFSPYQWWFPIKLPTSFTNHWSVRWWIPHQLVAGQNPVPFVNIP